jgi:hypothetical protein
VADQLFDHHHHHRVPAPARRGAALRLRLLRGAAGAVRFHGAGLAAGRQAGVGVFQQHHVRECGAGLEEAAGDGGAPVRGSGEPLGKAVDAPPKFGALLCQPVQMRNRSTSLDLTKSPAIAPKACYRLCFLSC